MILAGDIGGTKTNLALFNMLGNRLELVHQHKFKSADFWSFNDVILEFQKKFSISKVTVACFGIAGPVIDGVCSTTNLPWKLETEELQQLLKTKQVKLLNDLEATAYGMLQLSKEEFVQLNPNAVPSKGNRAVIAAGTGLGEGMLFDDGDTFHPIASEGGHCDFAPLTVQQDELLRWLRREYPEHVSYERVLSGIGIYMIYKFLVHVDFAPEPQAMLELGEGEDPSAMISHCALTEEDTLCVETLNLFCKIYAAEAGNLVLKTMSLGGVYIGGGIAPKILPILEQSNFMESFTAKGRFKDKLNILDVKVALNQETALLGAGHYAKDKLY